jgi:hypothetical protein
MLTRQSSLLRTVITLCAVSASPVAAQKPVISVGPNIRISQATEVDRNEGWLAASLTNPNFLVGVSHGRLGQTNCVLYYSTDAGYRWKESSVMTGQNCFDAMSTPGPDGKMYVLGTAVAGSPAPTGQRSESPIGVWYTTDTGKTWKGPALLRTPLSPDHPRMVVDATSSRFRGRVYVTWNEGSDTFFRGKYYIFMNRSENDGTTFAEPTIMTIDSGGKLVTTEPLVLSDGTLLVTYYQYFQPLNSTKNEHQPVYLLRSTDGGVTFGKPEKIGTVGLSAWRGRAAWGKLFGGAFTLPIFAVDGSSASRYRDRIYMVWDDVSTGDSNIWIISSSDQGRTWTPKKRINDNGPVPKGGPKDFRMTPVVAVNKDGVVGVAWYDRREDPARQCWKYYFSTSLDGGATWSQNVPVSTAPSCPKKGTPPAVMVLNKQADTVLPTTKTVDSLVALGKFGEAMALDELIAARERDSARTRGSVFVTFDTGRGEWPGHYTGLAASSDGIFHAMWADRRGDTQQFYGARIDVSTQATVEPTALKEAVVTDLVEVIAGPAKYDTAKGTTTFDIQLRNTSKETIYGPVRLRIKDVSEVNGTPTLEIVDSDSNRKDKSPYWDFTNKLGTRKRFEPGMVTEARSVTIRTRKDTGLDAELVFEVLARK